MPGILRKVWDNRSKIMEGITNTVFIRKEVEIGVKRVSVAEFVGDDDI